jgi:starch phosphorylase
MQSQRDVVCGMTVSEADAVVLTHEGRKLYFCSDTCRRWFEAEPQRFGGAFADAGKADGERSIAYFSMEVAIDPRMPTYAGGLGVLAGDMLKSFADLRIPAIGVTLLYRSGYFDQTLDEAGNQHERPVAWEPTQFVRAISETVHVSIEGHRVAVRAWRYDVLGATGYTVPLYLLDTDLDENAGPDRGLTASLYGGDERYRLAQEMVLGIGGVRMLRALGYTNLRRFHMNEGHAAFVPLELLNEPGPSRDFEAMRSHCVFTTHTPVPAGHDQFPYDLVGRVFTEPMTTETIQMLAGHDRLNMTRLALNTSRYVNGVAKRHGEVTREMFAGYEIDSITNGVHARTWTAESFRFLYDRYIGGWVNDPFALRYAISIPRSEIWEAHALAKSQLMQEVARRTGRAFGTEVFTIGVARRATPYKRADLVLSDPEKLMEIASTVGPIQMVFAGKAHPRDEGGKELVRRIFEAARRFDAQVSVVYLENYDMALAQRLTAGVDLWLNTPARPLEASGTSGMKAALNGVPSFSVLDGWWVEGHAEGVTGWSIGPRPSGTTRATQQTSEQDAQDLYLKLRAVILPMFYEDRDRWTDVMRQTIAFNASFFNTHRMVQQYTANAYL